VVDISLPVFGENPMFRYAAFGKLENEGFGVIDANDGVEVRKHFIAPFSFFNSIACAQAPDIAMPQ
jgi:hypothetical protein